MDKKEEFFEIIETRTSRGTRVNLILLECVKRGIENAYLGFYEELQPMFGKSLVGLGRVELPASPRGAIGIIYRNGSPVEAPRNWKELVVKSLEFQDPSLVIIEETDPGVVDDNLTFANPAWVCGQEISK